MAKRHLSRRQNWRIEKIQEERAARAAKRESHTLETLEGGELGPEQLGLVIAHFGVQVEVEALDGELAGQDVYYLDSDAIAKEAQYDGFYGICTNLDDNPLDILAVNRGRWEIEAAFRIMKSELKARPVYLKRDDRIQAHFLTCFIALLIYRIMTKKIQTQLPENSPSGETIVKTLSQMDFLEKEGDGFIPTYTRTDITDALHDAFGFRTDLELVPNREMRKIVNLTKTQK